MLFERVKVCVNQARAVAVGVVGAQSRGGCSLCSAAPSHKEANGQNYSRSPSSGFTDT